jgi:pimeloyl-ACP methyl ester carboxylesterase
MIRRLYVDGLWGQVHVRRARGGDAPLILLHQSPLCGDQFEPAMALLAGTGFDVLALDMPGYGLSDPPPSPASIADHAEALAALLDELGHHCVNVLGHHTGALIAAAFAASHPKRVMRLILNGVPLLDEAERAHFANFRFDPLVPAVDGAHLLAAWNQRLTATPGWSDLGAMHRHVVTMLANPLRYGWGFEAAFAHDAAADLMTIICPTLILTNSGDDLYAASRRAHTLRPDLAYVELPDGTHDIVDEQPVAWAQTVVAFLTESG